MFLKERETNKKTQKEQISCPTRMVLYVDPSACLFFLSYSGTSSFTNNFLNFLTNSIFSHCLKAGWNWKMENGDGTLMVFPGTGPWVSLTATQWSVLQDWALTGKGCLSLSVRVRACTRAQPEAR
ncbi:hypothetical protein AALO_G00123730 [Alosa alosa]|uniref:Guanylate cyclase domain-containing protein n=1 Tax=Alosa alosa TaxID=278164 RepID=A0AAV6GLP3_9TELE|nr:hypothetical protein AALO_G00123730 [Alosa alosa]